MACNQEFPFEHPFWDIKFKYVDLQRWEIVFDDDSRIPMPKDITVEYRPRKRDGKVGWCFMVNKSFLGDFIRPGIECKTYLVRKMRQFEKRIRMVAIKGPDHPLLKKKKPKVEPDGK